MKKSIFCSATIFLLALLLMVSGSADAGGVEVGSVDGQRVLETSKEGKRTIGTMKEYLKNRQKEIDLDEQDLKKTKAYIEKEGASLSSEKKRVMQQNFQGRLADHRRKIAGLQEEVKKEKNRLINDFKEKLKKAVKQISEKDGYILVVDTSEKDEAIYLKDGADLTSKMDLTGKKFIASKADLTAKAIEQMDRNSDFGQ